MNEAELRAIYESIEGHQPHTLHWNTDGTPKYINRLINTQSPYLLRHAHNPDCVHAVRDKDSVY